MKILALAIMALATVNTIQLRIAKKQEKRINELEAQNRINKKFESEEI